MGDAGRMQGDGEAEAEGEAELGGEAVGRRGRGGRGRAGAVAVAPGVPAAATGVMGATTTTAARLRVAGGRAGGGEARADSLLVGGGRGRRPVGARPHPPRYALRRLAPTAVKTLAQRYCIEQSHCGVGGCDRPARAPLASSWGRACPHACAAWLARTHAEFSFSMRRDSFHLVAVPSLRR